jgi:putative ABC transport system permease protein
VSLRTGWRRLVRGLAALARREQDQQDVADEVEHYVEQSAAEHRRRGLSPEEARRAARLELGSPLGVRDQVLAAGWEDRVHGWLTDVRFAWRRLKADPAFTIVTLLTLAIGIGGATAILGAVKPVLFDPLPYPDPDRVVSVWEAGRDGARNHGTFAMVRALAERSTAFERLAVARPWQPTLTGRGEPERLEARRVSAGYFEVLGVAPAMGHTVTDDDDRAGAPLAIVLSDRLWRRRFGADLGLLGAVLTLDDVPVTVVGIMPPGFQDLVAPTAQAWAPLQYELGQPRAWGHHLRVIGRLRPGVTPEQAQRELDQLGAQVIREERPESYGSEVRFEVPRLQDDLTSTVRPALLLIVGAVGLVLLMACVNVTNLLLARGVQRRGEFALRAALGASERRLARQVLVETLFLAALGALLGMGVAVTGVRALAALSPAELPRADAIRVHPGILLIGLSVTTVVGLLVALVPARQAARFDPSAELQQASSRTAGGHRRLRGALVVSEVALALMLLAGAGLLVRSLGRLFKVDPGFRAEGALSLQLQVSAQRYDDPAVRRFFSEVLEAVRQSPGIEAAALTTQLPLSGDLDLYGARAEGGTAPADDQGVFAYVVSPGYAEVMGIALRRGRTLTAQDDERAPLVALVSESFARRRFGPADPLGRRFTVGPVEQPVTIVGVVADVRQQSLALGHTDAVYLTPAQWPFGERVMSLVARGPGEPAALAPVLRRAVWSVDPHQSVARVTTLSALVKESGALRRFALRLFQAFGLAALVLAAAGIYGVLSGAVTERTREIGVRAALGASRRQILSLVLAQALRLTVVGVALGLAGAVAAGRAMGTLLYEVSPLDPVTYIAVIGVLVPVGLLVSALPAWRAVNIDPIRTLRVD